MPIPGNNLRDNLFMTPATMTETEFIKKTNEEYIAWCKTYYSPEALDERGMLSLHGLWAWQEQEKRIAEAESSERLGHSLFANRLIECDQLRDLLRPFAALLQDHNRHGPDEQPIFQINGAKITRGDLRRALAATEQKEQVK